MKDKLEILKKQNKKLKLRIRETKKQLSYIANETLAYLHSGHQEVVEAVIIKKLRELSTKK
jgi:hypothetical protein